MVCIACGSDNLNRRLRVTSQLSIAFCGNCHSGRAELPPDAEALGLIYDAEYYDAGGVADRNIDREVLKRATFARRLDDCAKLIPDGGCILDLGCATGFFLQEAEERGWRSFGVDISAAAIGLCQPKTKPERLYCGQFENATFRENPTNEFDAIFMSDYLEHVLDPASVIGVAVNRLRAGGAIVINTPDVQSLSRKLMGKHWPHFKIEHVSYFSLEGITGLFDTAGLDVVASWPTVKALSIAYLARHFEKYPNKWISPWLTTLGRALPGSAANAIMWIPTGELTLVGKRRQAANTAK